ncbi:hypothetical protein SDJN02_18153, partial [Cucurbita argyrosperma subsp. argyrosperma]
KFHSIKFDSKLRNICSATEKWRLAATVVITAPVETAATVNLEPSQPPSRRRMGAAVGVAAHVTHATAK